MGRFDELTKLDETPPKQPPKKLEPAAVVEELRSPKKDDLKVSSFFANRKPPSPPQKRQQATSSETTTKNTPKETTSTGQEKRVIRTRHPFDIFQDQYDDLRQLNLQLQMRGEKCSMSQMVRKALDNYIPLKRKEIR